jgi:outer membrane protein assembly factor BamB
MRTQLLAVLALAACGRTERVEEPGCDAWRQWGNDAGHQGASCVTGQRLEGTLDNLVYDPFIAQETADARGNLVVHYQAPLIDGDRLYMMTKRGTYTPCAIVMDKPSCSAPGQEYRRSSQIWVEQHFAIGAGGRLALQWSFESDWKPEPAVNFEPMFQPALAGTLLVVPGAGGAVWQLDATSGQVIRHVVPFGAVDPDTYVAGGLAVGPDDTIYYTALKLDHDQPLTLPPAAWLVAVSPDGTARTADWATLVRGAPQPTDACFGTYDAMTTPLPWPPANPDGTLLAPPSAPCGPQRPGINATPAIGPDGTIFLVSRAHNNGRYSYVVAVDPTLSPRWATSLRDILDDGCGVTNAFEGAENANMFACRAGAPVGVERVTGLRPAPQVVDDSSSSPVALPDGGVLYGAFTGYNNSRGHTFKLDERGAVVATYDFGWDSTPAVFGGPSNYKIIIKDNHYGEDEDGVDFGPFYITALDASLRAIWRFQSTNTRSCVRQPDGSKDCVADHPNGFEWCVNAVAVDADGTVFANSEDGNAYAITADGKFRDAVFLETSLGAAYTPIALDRAGRIFALNNGQLSVLGHK